MGAPFKDVLVGCDKNEAAEPPRSCWRALARITLPTDR